MAGRVVAGHGWYMLYLMCMFFLVPVCCSLKDRYSWSGCSGCQENTLPPHKLRELRIEFIKYQILQKLKMSVAPNSTAPPPGKLPGPFLEHFRAQEQQEEEIELGEFASTTDIAVLAQIDRSCTSTPASECLRFNMSSVEVNVSVNSAVLWIYISKDNYMKWTFTTLSCTNNGPRTRCPSQREPEVRATARAGWVQVPLHHMVKHWMKSSHKKHGLRVTCTTCNGSAPIATRGSFAPFLVLHMDRPVKRHKRYVDLDCAPNTKFCCRDRLRFSFADIGWTWVAQPHVYKGYYCRGSCRGLVNPTYNHTTVLQLLDNPSVSPCCAPKSLGSMSMLYHTEGSYKVVHLQGMIVEKCGCA